MKRLFVLLVLFLVICTSVFSFPYTITLHLRSIVPTKAIVMENLFSLEYDDDVFGVEIISGAEIQDNGSYLTKSKDVVISFNVIM